MKSKQPAVSKDAGTRVNLERRLFMGTVAATGAGMSLGAFAQQGQTSAPPIPTVPHKTRRAVIILHVNGVAHELAVEPRVTLLDALREQLKLTGTKKGCDRGQCGACTVIVDGRRINSCLALAVMYDGARITTVEGLASDGQPSVLQRAFVEYDAFQCGFCTPGQLCSATAMLAEAQADTISAATADLKQPRKGARLPDAEIRERMSGNICRCGAYPNIVAAIRDSASKAT